MENNCSLPRILLGATGSGSGKTTITCGLLKLLQRAGRDPISFKCGPDYIDPMFHKEVLGINSRNLDLFFNEEDTVRMLMGRHYRKENANIAVIEGVMGYYDGLGGTSVTAGSYDLARATRTPAILIVDGRGKSYSLVAEIKGFLELKKESMIAGVIINRVSPGMYPLFKEMIEQNLPVQVLGYLPVLESGVLESRHLGLVTATEVKDLEQMLENLASVMEKTVNIQEVIALAETAPLLSRKEPDAFHAGEYKGVRLAIAKDEAFCFYYEDNLDILRQMGAELVEFSPLISERLPDEIHGLLLGGGYPELYMDVLSSNTLLRRSLLSALERGLPCLAECGGFMFLHDWIEDEDENRFPGVGFLKGGCLPKKKPIRFGYITLTAQEDNLLGKKGATVRGHEFHYWESEKPGKLFRAEKPTGRRNWECMVQQKNTLAGFPHLNYRSNPAVASNFLKKCFEKIR